MIGRNLRTLTNTQCIQTTHYIQDAKHQYEAIKENYNEYVKDHRFKPTCTHSLRCEFIEESKLLLVTAASQITRAVAIPFRKASPVYLISVGANRTILMRIV
jgi:hypothetical protein